MSDSRMGWANTLTEGLLRVKATVAAHAEDSLAKGARDVVLADALARMPKESGHLAGTGRVEQSRGGTNTVGVTFDGPYARWTHEHLFFRHPQGGEAKFLELAMVEHGAEALDVAGRDLWGRL